MYIPLDMNDTPKTKHGKLSEDRKEMIGSLLAFVVMGSIFLFMLFSLSDPCNNTDDSIVNVTADCELSTLDHGRTN